MHPEVARFCDAYDAQCRAGRREVKLGEIEVQFLEDIFGPEFSYNFEGLTAQFPFKDYRGGNRYADFYYEKGSLRLIIEIDSLKYHVTAVTAAKYDDHQERQNDLVLSGGWVLLRLTANMIMRRPMVCRRQLMQAVGRSFILSNLQYPLRGDGMWHVRKQHILQCVNPANGIVKASAVAASCGVDKKTAGRWLSRMAEEGWFVPIVASERVVGYRSKITPPPSLGGDDAG